MTISLYRTARGFARADFIDLYGSECSIQESSRATGAALWLGVDRDFDERESSTGHRMHLSQEMAAALIPLLARFVETGSLE